VLGSSQERHLPEAKGKDQQERIGTLRGSHAGTHRFQGGKHSQTFIARTDKEITKASGPVTCLIRLSARRKALRCKANIHSLASFGYWNGKAIRNKKRLEADTRPVKRAGATPLRVLVDLTHRPPLISSKHMWGGRDESDTETSSHEKVVRASNEYYTVTVTR